MKNNNRNCFLVSFAIGFCLVLVLGFTATASAQIPRIEVPAGSSDPCFAAFTRAYNSGNSISDAEAVEITRVCVDMDLTQAGFFEGIADALNGPDNGRPVFGNIMDVMGYFRTCRIMTFAACGEEEEPPATTRRLVVECRGACAEGPGITDGLRGRGWGRVAVCREGTVPLSLSWRHAVVGDATRRRAESGTVLDITYCFDPSAREAPRVIERDAATVDLSDLWNHIHRLEHACGDNGMRDHSMETGTMERSPEWVELCTRFDTVVIHTTQIRQLTIDVLALTTRLDDLEQRVDGVEEIQAADCGRTAIEWHGLTQAQRVALYESGACDTSSTTTVVNNGWHIHLDVGLGLHLVGLSAPANIIAPHGVVHAELEALPTEHFGFYLRGMIGAGDLLDRIGQFNPAGTIGFEGIAGGSAGATFRFNEYLALDAGIAASFGFNPGGQIGTSLHAWPWFQIGGELRLRVNPLPWLTIGATIGLAHTHSEILRPNVDHFIGVDAMGGSGTLDVAVHF